MFNVLPPTIREQIAPLVALFAVLMMAYAATKPGSASASPISEHTALLLLVGIASVVALSSLFSPQQDYAKLFRDWLPFIFAAISMRAARQIRMPLIGKLGALTLLVAVAYRVAVGTETVAGLQRPASLTGGQEGIHSSALLLFIALVATIVAYKGGGLQRWQAYVLTGTAAYLLFQFKVATAGVASAIYLLLVTTRARFSRFKVSRLVGAAVVVFAVILGHEILTQGKFALGAESGSGRLASWSLRIKILTERPFDDLLFGTGAASDRFFTSVWWWDAKDAHSDLLTLLIEYGLYGILAAASIYAVAWKSTSAHGRAILLAALTASVVSNALFSRPIHAMIAWILVLSAVQIQTEPTTDENRQQRTSTSPP